MRYLELDWLRGLAVVNMMVFHLLYMMWREDLIEVNLFTGPGDWWGNAIRITFITLVGIGLSITWSRAQQKGEKLGHDLKKTLWEYWLRRWKRAVQIAVAALFVTIATYFVIPEQFVRFGILHYLALSVVIGSLLAPIPPLAAVVGMITFFFIRGDVPLGWSNWLTEILWGWPAHATVDLFPFFDWFHYVCLGIVVGWLLYDLLRVQQFRWHQKLQQGFAWKVFQPLNWIGAHALLVYVVHGPILWTVVQIIA